MPSFSLHLCPKGTEGWATGRYKLETRSTSRQDCESHSQLRKYIIRAYPSLTSNMAALSTLVISTFAHMATAMPQTNAQPSDAPALYVPDTKARNAVIFGVIATLLTIIGIIIASATLRVAYQSSRPENSQTSNDIEVEMGPPINDNRTLSQASTIDGAVEQDEA
jgi:hypothetical protein